MAASSLIERLDILEPRFEEVSTLITDPAVIADQQRYVRLTKEYHDLERMLQAKREYVNALGAVEESKQILAEEEDEEMRQLARQ